MPTTTTFMGLTIPDVQVTIGPTYATLVNSDLSLLDAHDHSPGKGTQIPTAGIGINADLSFAGFNLKTLRAARFSNLSVNITPGGAEVTEIYVYNGDLWYVNAAGVAIQLTLGSAINTATSGSITGMGGTGAAVTYSNVSHTFTFTQAGNQAASIDAANVVIRDTAVGANGVTLKASSGTAAYTLTLPTGLPGNSELLWMTSAGLIGYGGAVVSTSAVTFNGGITTSTLTASGVAALNGGATATTLTTSGAVTLNGTATFATTVIFQGSTTVNVGLILPSTALASAATPGAGNLTLYQDSLSGKVSQKRSDGGSMPVYMAVANSALAFSFSTTETMVAGGKTGGTNAPSSNFQLPGNTLVVGSTFRVKVYGRCTTSGANSVTFTLKAGTNGTTADTAIVTYAVTAAASGVNVPFAVELVLSLHAVGASASGNAFAMLTNAGTTGLATQAVSASLISSGIFDSTAAKYYELTAVTGAAGTTLEIDAATMEIVC